MPPNSRRQRATSFAELKSWHAEQRLAQAQAQQRAEALAREAARERAAQEAQAQEFQRAVGPVTPLPDRYRQRVIHHPRTPLPYPQQRLADERAALLASMSDGIDYDTLLDSDDSLSFRRDGIAPDVLRKMRRGTWVVQGELDLHGFRRDEAREALAGFLRVSMMLERRCVRVIHGKGLGSANREPILKSKVRQWLQQRDEVLAYCQAAAQDGGAGALLVLLRGGAGRDKTGVSEQR